MKTHMQYRLSSRSMTGGSTLMRHPQPASVIDGGRKRRGVTLSEVLVSLLVMSVGVVAVATLFPLSVFRTIQATQLTNAAQLRYNFEGMAGARPELYAGTEAWKPNKEYAVGDLIVTTLPNEYFLECTNGGTSGVLEPTWRGVGQTTTDNGAEWQARRARLFVVDPMGWQQRTEDLRDLGFAPAVSQANIRNTFGRTALASATATVALDSRYRIVRFRGGLPISNLAAPWLNPSNSVFMPNLGSAAGRAQEVAANFGARQTSVLPDSWLPQTDTTDITLPAAPVTTIQLNNLSASLVDTLDANNDNTVDFTIGTGAEQALSARVTLFDATGKFSHVRPLTGITTPSTGVEELAWTAPLPTGFVPVRAKVETFEPRYTWMLTGRRNGPAAYMNLVVFFRRSTDPEDELIHPAHFQSVAYRGLDGQPGVAGTDDNNNMMTDEIAELGWPGSDDVIEPYTVVVQYHAALGGQRPFVKRGGFVCDSQSNRWYRITSYREVDNANAALSALDSSAAGVLAATPGVVLKLDQSALESTGIYNTGDTTAATSNPGAILMPGIIDVYPLQPQLPWENE
jgi:type II secretory pathway pseudopilin PulG